MDKPKDWCGECSCTFEVTPKVKRFFKNLIPRRDRKLIAQLYKTKKPSRVNRIANKLFKLGYTFSIKELPEEETTP